MLLKQLSKQAIALSLMWVACLCSLKTQAQSTGVIGSGASSGTLNGPIYRSTSTSSFRYSKDVYLFTASEMSAAGITSGSKIKKISWFKNGNSVWASGKMGKFKLYVLDTTNYSSMWSSSGNRAWSSLINSATKVFEGTVGASGATVNINNTGWITFDFSSSPVTYNGGAFRVMVNWNYTGSTPVYTSSGTNAGIGWSLDAAASGTVYGMASNGNAPNATTTDTSQVYAGASPNGNTYSGNRPQIQFTFDPPACSGTPSGYSVSGPAFALCNGDAAFLALTGIVPAGGIKYQWQSSSSSTGPFTNISGDSGTTISTPGLTSTTYYRTVITCTNSGLADSTSPFSAVVNANPSVSSTTNGSRCGTGAVNISAGGTAPYFLWYDKAQGGHLLAINNGSYAPSVSSTTTFYVSNGSGDTTSHVETSPGVGNTVISGGSIDSIYLKFDVIHSLRLKNVTIYAAKAGTYTISVANSSGTTMGTGSVTVSSAQISSGSFIPILVPINAYLPAANSYYIFLNTGNIASLGIYIRYANNEPVIYPQTIPGLINISTTGFISTGGTFTDNNDIFGTGVSTYMGFFKFNVVPDCESSRSAVTATVSTPSAITVTPSNSGYCQGSGGLTGESASSSASYDYTWSGGSYTGITGAHHQHISANPANTTTFVVTGTDTTTHCSATDTFTVNVNPAPPVFNTLANPSTTCPGVPFTLTTNIYQNISYCNPAFVNGTNLGAFLDSVILDTLKYHSHDSASSNLFVPAATTTTTLLAGHTYTIKLKAGASNEIYNAWIDLNGDGNFDNSTGSQEIIVNNVNGSTTSSTATFTLPSYIVSGKKRMRIRMDRGFIFEGPCTVAGTNSSYNGEGQVIDFIVNVIGNTLSYAWSPTASLSNPTSDSTASSGITSSTTYTVIVKDLSSLCYVTQSTTVTIVPASISIQADPTAICGTGTTSLSTTNLTSGATIQWQQASAATGPFTNFGSGANPDTTGTISTVTYYKALATCGTSHATSNTLKVNVGAAPVTPSGGNATSCGSAAVSLKVTGGGTGITNYNWFDSANAVNTIFTGSNYTTPMLNANTKTVYYVSAYKDLGTNTTSASKSNRSPGHGGPNYFYNWEAFKTYVPMKINGVYVYPSYNSGGIAGTDSVTWFRVMLLDSNGNFVDSVTVHVTAAMVNNATNGIPTFVPLNFNIPNPAVYYMARVGKLTNTTGGASYIGLWRDNTGGVVHYPYTLPGVVSVFNSVVSNTFNPNGYYYFYNWSVSYNLRCTGPRTTDTVWVYPSTAGGTVTPSSSTVCSGNSQLFTVTGHSGLHTQWQYNTSYGGSLSSWTNFGIDDTTSTLSSVTSALYVRALAKSPTCPDVTSTIASVLTDNTSLSPQASGITTTGAIVTWNTILGASYTVSVNGGSAVSATSPYTVSGLSSCSSNKVVINVSGATCSGAPTADSVTFSTPATALAVTLSAGSGSNINASWTSGTGPYKLYYTAMQSLPGFISVTVTGTSYTIKSVKAGATYIAYVVDMGSTCSNKAQSSFSYYNASGGTCTGSAPSITGSTATTTSINLSWSGTASAYQVYYKAINATTYKSYATTGTSFSATGLQPNTCYLAFVINRCSSTTSGYSSQIDTICTPKLCTTPSGLILSNATCHGFTASWTAVSGASNYSVYIVRTTGAGAPVSISYRSTSNIITVSTLGAGGNTFAVYIRANCSVGGQSQTSNVESIATLSSGCKDDGNANTLISANTDMGKLSVYPNPNNGQFMVELMSSNTTENATVHVMNMLGQVVYENVVGNTNGLIRANISDSKLAAGVYLVRVQLGSESHVARVVIQ